MDAFKRMFGFGSRKDVSSTSSSPPPRDSRPTYQPPLDDDDDSHVSLLPPWVLDCSRVYSDVPLRRSTWYLVVETPQHGCVGNDEWKQYRQCVEELEGTLPVRASVPYDRNAQRLPQESNGKDLAPEEAGTMLEVVSATVPSPNLPYVLPDWVPPPTPSQSWRPVYPPTLHLQKCGKCQGPIYGKRYDCNNCNGPVPYCICEACERAGKKRHSDCRSNAYFQGYETVVRPEASQLILYRYYSAVVSFPEDYLAFVYAPAHHHYQEQWRNQLKNIFFVGSTREQMGHAQVFSLWAHDLREQPDLLRKSEDSTVLVDTDVRFFRQVGNYTLSFEQQASQLAHAQRVALPLILMWAEPADVRACMAVSRSWYHVLRESNALARAKLQHISYGLADGAVQKHCNGAYGAAWKLLQNHRTYARLVCLRGIKHPDDLYMVIDVNLCLWRRVQACRIPDSEEAVRAQQEFLRANPGYID